jgi:hypothetical protein
MDYDEAAVDQDLVCGLVEAGIGGPATVRSLSWQYTATTAATLPRSFQSGTLRRGLGRCGGFHYPWEQHSVGARAG